MGRPYCTMQPNAVVRPVCSTWSRCTGWTVWTRGKLDKWLNTPMSVAINCQHYQFCGGPAQCDPPPAQERPSSRASSMKNPESTITNNSSSSSSNNSSKMEVTTMSRVTSQSTWLYSNSNRTTSWCSWMAMAGMA